MFILKMVVGWTCWIQPEAAFTILLTECSKIIHNAHTETAPWYVHVEAKETAENLNINLALV